jgi:hypothetical protein
MNEDRISWIMKGTVYALVIAAMLLLPAGWIRPGDSAAEKKIADLGTQIQTVIDDLNSSSGSGILKEGYKVLTGDDPDSGETKEMLGDLDRIRIILKDGRLSPGELLSLHRILGKYGDSDLFRTVLAVFWSDGEKVISGLNIYMNMLRGLLAGTILAGIVSAVLYILGKRYDGFLLPAMLAADLLYFHVFAVKLNAALHGSGLFRLTAAPVLALLCATAACVLWEVLWRRTNGHVPGLLAVSGKKQTDRDGSSL